MSIFSFFLLRINIINIVTMLIVDFFYRIHAFYHYALMMVIVKLVSSGTVWGGLVRLVGWFGGMNNITTLILSPSRFLFIYINNDTIITITTTISISRRSSWWGCSSLFGYVIFVQVLYCMGQSGIVGYNGMKWLSGMSEVEEDGWIPPSPSSL